MTGMIMNSTVEFEHRHSGCLDECLLREQTILAGLRDRAAAICFDLLASLFFGSVFLATSARWFNGTLGIVHLGTIARSWGALALFTAGIVTYFFLMEWAASQLGENALWSAGANAGKTALRFRGSTRT